MYQVEGVFFFSTCSKKAKVICVTFLKTTFMFTWYRNMMVVHVYIYYVLLVFCERTTYYNHKHIQNNNKHKATIIADGFIWKNYIAMKQLYLFLFCFFRTK